MKNKKKKITLIVLSIILIVIIVLIIVLFLKGGDNNTVHKQTETTSAETETTINRENMMHSYLTGEWVDNEIGLRRPMAVMLNNIKAGVPQTGISKASIVYEAPVEGGITRLLALFEDYDDLDKIGSVRSARTYYVYLALEYDPILVHYGEAYYAESLLDSGKVSNLSGTSEIGKTVFYRTTDRVSPHNAYTSAEGIEAGIKAMKYKTELSDSDSSHFIFTDDSEQNDLNNGTSALKVQIGYKTNTPWFEYNQNDGLYYRFQYSGEQIDDMNNQQICYKNVILQYCSYSLYDANGYLNIDVNSSGTGKYITNGKSIDIKWSKDSEFGKTNYYDSNNQEITINQGKTWICIIQKDQVNKVQIE